MVINIPINVDDELLNKSITEDYCQKVEDRIFEALKKVLKTKTTYYSATYEDGLIALTERQIDNLLSQHKDEIIEYASEKLASRLAKTKAAKELLKEKE